MINHVLKAKNMAKGVMVLTSQPFSRYSFPEMIAITRIQLKPDIVKNT